MLERKTMLKNIILVGIILTFFVSCGGGDSKKNTDDLDLIQMTPTPSPTPSPTQTATPTLTPISQIGFTRDNQNKIVIDHAQQIMWQDDIQARKTKACWLTDPDFLDCQAGLPQQYRPSCDNHSNRENCNAGFTPLPRHTAYEECNNLTLGGYNDWHVPTLEDLKSIVDTSREKAPFINPIFKNTTSLQYWSSTVITRTPSLAWVIFFGDRTSSHVKFDKNTEIGIRCVRDIK
jgi:hypothetical protein